VEHGDALIEVQPMLSMIVFPIAAAPDHVSGALSHWLVATRPGLFVWTMSARVRDDFRSAASARIENGLTVLAHPADTEQDLVIHMAMRRRKHVVDFGGLRLIELVAQARVLTFRVTRKVQVHL
jgi:CRISPR-associated protein Cas2